MSNRRRRPDAPMQTRGCALTASELLRKRVIQGFEVTGTQAIFDCVPHFKGHTQEVIHMTRCLLGDKYRLAWEPTTPEQGAP